MGKYDAAKVVIPDRFEVFEGNLSFRKTQTVLERSPSQEVIFESPLQPYSTGL